MLGPLVLLAQRCCQTAKTRGPYKGRMMLDDALVESQRKTSSTQIPPPPTIGQDPHSSHHPMVCCSHSRHIFEHFHLPHRAACCSSSLFFDLSTKHPHVQVIFILLMQSVKLLETRTYSSSLLIIVNLPHRRHSSTNYKTCVDDSRPHSYTPPNTQFPRVASCNAEYRSQ